MEALNSELSDLRNTQWTAGLSGTCRRSCLSLGRLQRIILCLSGVALMDFVLNHCSNSAFAMPCVELLILNFAFILELWHTILGTTWELRLVCKPLCFIRNWIQSWQFCIYSTSISLMSTVRMLSWPSSWARRCKTLPVEEVYWPAIHWITVYAAGLPQLLLKWRW